MYFKPKGQASREIRFYSILSTEKSQDGNVVYANTHIVLKEVLQHLDNGAKDVEFQLSNGLLEILEDTDGCAVQYRCSTAFNILHKLAFECNLIYDRAVDVEGHGKRNIDEYSGTDKTDLVNNFRGNVEYQPEAVNPNKRTNLIFQMENGKRRDLSDLCHKILSMIERS